MEKKAVLLILDGWGIPKNPNYSAIKKANTPFIDSLYQQYPNASLRTDGEHVGLPKGQMGNSEVGHMNLGAGRIVYQDLAKINMAVQNNSLLEEPVLKQAFDYAKANQKPIHFIGLVSDGGVHSHIDHLKGLIKTANDYGITEKYIHAFTDGRDVDPKSGKGFLTDLEHFLPKQQAKLASVIGRYYAMDRDKRWERTAEAYNLLTQGKGKPTTNITQSIQELYDADITDEFITPLVITENEKPVATIQEEDVVIFFNFRTDRGRQLTECLTQQDFPEYNLKAFPLYFVTLTNYDDSYKNIKVVFNKANIKATLGEVLAYTGKTQLRAAETEKYPHVTFFFSGGREKPFQGEERILVHSPKVATYDLKPEMSAYELTEKLVPHLEEGKIDFFCINFANPDMVGHTGDFNAAIKACETVDECAKKLVEAGQENYTFIILADHGNSEKMRNDDGSPNTAHTTNPVPVFLIENEQTHAINDGILGDIAPTLLEIMGIEKPALMTQKSLLTEKL